MHGPTGNCDCVNGKVLEGFEDCSRCGASGVEPCKRCGATGKERQGDGKVRTCLHCRGLKVHVLADGSKAPCRKCHGHGDVPVWKRCPKCEGTGRIQLNSMSEYLPEIQVAAAV